MFRGRSCMHSIGWALSGGSRNSERRGQEHLFLPQMCKSTHQELSTYII